MFCPTLNLYVLCTYCVSYPHTPYPYYPNCILLISSLPCSISFFILTLSFSSPSLFCLILLSPSHPSSSFVTHPHQVSSPPIPFHPLCLLIHPSSAFSVPPQPVCSSQHYPSLRFLSFSSPVILFSSISSIISIFNAIIWNEERTPTYTVKG
jgi:hypothetical protein